MPPRVSVLIPIYTPGPVLRRCLSSVARQTYADLEILAIDDAGSEPVQGVIDEFARDDVRWKTVSHERSLGLSASLNDVLRNSTGPYVLVLQQDCEILGEDAIEDAVSLMEQDDHRCLSGEPVLVLPEMSPTQVAFAAIWNHLPESGDPDLEPVGFSELKCDLFPRIALLAGGAFEERLRISGEDQVLSHRLWSSGWPIVRSAALRFVLRPGRPPHGPRDGAGAPARPAGGRRRPPRAAGRLGVRRGNGRRGPRVPRPAEDLTWGAPRQSGSPFRRSMGGRSRGALSSS